MSEAGLLDDGQFGLEHGGRRGGRAGLWLHGDGGALSGQAVGGLDPAGVGRQHPRVVGGGGGTPVGRREGEKEREEGREGENTQGKDII